MEYKQLGNTDINISKVSFGASSIGHHFRPIDEKEGLKVVEYALQAGINYIDTAPFYGQGKSEENLGKALQGIDIPREKYHIATKVARYEKQIDKMFDFSAQKTIQSVNNSLAKLGTTYIDVIQVHDVEFAPSPDIILSETLPALQKLKDEGKVHYIGVTGYPIPPLRDLVERSTVKIDTILTYCRYSMNDTSLLDHLPFFKEHGVGIINASPISMGLLSKRGPPAWHSGQKVVKEACANAAEYCQERGVDISKLAMHFALEQPDVHSTLVGTASVANLETNVKAVTETLSDLEKNTMDEVLTKFMEPLNNMNWEGIELEKYWRKMKLLQGNTSL